MMGVEYRNTTRTCRIEDLSRGVQIKVDGKTATVTRVHVTEGKHGWTTIDYVFGDVQWAQESNGTLVELA